MEIDVAKIDICVYKHDGSCPQMETVSFKEAYEIKGADVARVDSPSSILAEFKYFGIDSKDAELIHEFKSDKYTLTDEYSSYIIVDLKKIEKYKAELAAEEAAEASEDEEEDCLFDVLCY